MCTIMFIFSQFLWAIIQPFKRLLDTKHWKHISVRITTYQISTKHKSQITKRPKKTNDTTCQVKRTRSYCSLIFFISILTVIKGKVLNSAEWFTGLNIDFDIEQDYKVSISGTCSCSCFFFFKPKQLKIITSF